jgi:hypothetical protein
MRYQLPIWWMIWWFAATILALVFLAVNVQRRHSLTNSPEAAGLVLPGLREDLLWAGLVIFGGAGGIGIILLFLIGAHTARALMVAAIFSMVMLLGLVMLLKNGLAPTDSIRLDAKETNWLENLEPEDQEDFDPLRISQKHLRIRTNSGGFGSIID